MARPMNMSDEEFAWLELLNKREAEHKSHSQKIWKIAARNNAKPKTVRLNGRVVSYG